MKLENGAARAGQLLYMSGLAGLGVLSLIHRDFAMVWQPVPEWLPLRPVFGSVSGAILLLGSCGMAFERSAKPSALILAGFVSAWLLFLQLPKVAATPSNAAAWLGFGENLLLVCGAWILALRGGRALANSSVRRDSGGSIKRSRWTRAWETLFGISLPLIGISHFVYRDATAGMVPAWLPWRNGFALLTGAGHIAAGLAIVFSIVPALAGLCEATMIGAFVVLLHIPGVVADPTSRFQWTMLAIATAYCGSAWIVASSLLERRGLRATRAGR